jgi:galactose mutarotase-like enzyme
MIGSRTVEGLEALTLASPGESGLEAVFVPGAGMVGCSLRHRDQELLGQRGGLGAYVAERGTMGIPILHPWANRLAKRRFSAADREVSIEPPVPFSTDPNGLAIHGLLSAARGWRADKHEATVDGALLTARFDFEADPALLAAFPFPHQVLFEARLAGGALTITTVVRATGDAPVPVAFGYHPYLRLPGVDRAEWRVQIPVAERLLLDEQMIPTGEREAAEAVEGPLGSRTFDDAYLAPAQSAPFIVSGGGRRVEVRFDHAFPFVQLYAPADDDVIAIEPMTAPTNALVAGGSELPIVEPGGEYRASFSISVSADAG